MSSRSNLVRSILDVCAVSGFVIATPVVRTSVVISLLAAACTEADTSPVRSRGDFALNDTIHRHVKVCGDAPKGDFRCHASVRVDDITGQVVPSATPAGISPADLLSAYQLPPTGGAGVTVAIVDAYDDPNAEADLGNYRTTFGLSACTTANGCFRKVNQGGLTGPLPATNVNWSTEISLDVDMVSAVCASCNILLVEANSASYADLGAAVNTAVALGAKVISNSYGGNESQSDPTTANQYYSHTGVLIVASSGDSGYGVQFPAAAPWVLAVGGTHLVRDTTTPRGWTETAWAGAGAGCSAFETKPVWQLDSGCARRTVADVSAIADPNTGVAVYDTFGQGGWLVVGGTSVASPVVAATFALTDYVGVTPQLPYYSPNKFFDVVGGSDGSCTPNYLCTAVAGYDGPTGMGTPNGHALSVPAQPQGLFIQNSNLSTTQNGLFWNWGSFDNTAVFRVYRAGTLIATLNTASGAQAPPTSYVDNGVSYPNSYTYYLIGVSANGVAGPQSVSVTGTPNGPGCDASTCSGGCCNAQGQCDLSGADTSCPGNGTGGSACVDCTASGMACGWNFWNTGCL